ncbi:MAG: nucleotidyl transferase AbiEii/AbiGii toxin family protein, partial [Proteobacteria bacterium]|nr:nucleotidyl transferase AbiEii/AbiGii toxin family protein [Pseudomonadota bacterium]
MTAKKYATARAFRKALEDRLTSFAKRTGSDPQRLRRQVAFDRLLARLFSKSNPPWILKGGYALEIRLQNSRATKDIDLTLRKLLRVEDNAQKNDAILEMLAESASEDLLDFFVFQIGEPMLDLDNAPYGGGRFPINAQMDGRIFVKFHLDVGIGDVVVEPIEMVESHNFLEFAGIAPVKFPALSREQHLSDKLHAYTLPRGVLNSRVRDLIDMVLLIDSTELDPHRVADSITKTFLRRDTHVIPATLAPPPKTWEGPFVEMAEECGLKLSIEEAFEKIREFYSRLKLE